MVVILCHDCRGWTDKKEAATWTLLLIMDYYDWLDCTCVVLCCVCMSCVFVYTSCVMIVDLQVVLSLFRGSYYSWIYKIGLFLGYEGCFSTNAVI